MPKSTEHCDKRQLMVSRTEYYRHRADVERGLKKRDFPSIEQGEPLEKKNEQAVAEDKVPKPDKEA